MKKILLILFLLSTTLLADNIKWMKYDTALSVSQEQNKTIMVMLGRDSCHVCQYMKTVVFKDKNVIRKLNEKFLAVYIELDFDDVPNDLEYIGTPTFYFLDKDENKLYRFDGGKRVPSFIEMLDELN